MWETVRNGWKIIFFIYNQLELSILSLWDKKSHFAVIISRDASTLQSRYVNKIVNVK